jgi:hypothetical protein
MRFPVRELEDEVSSLSLRLREGTSPEAAARVLQRLIEARHNGADDTTLIVPMGLYRQNQQTRKFYDCNEFHCRRFITGWRHWHHEYHARECTGT